MRILAILFGLIITAHLWYSFSYIAYFKINQEEITEAYCENLSQPELKCNGQCHLAKQLSLWNESSAQEEMQGEIIGLKLIFSPVFINSVPFYSFKKKVDTLKGSIFNPYDAHLLAFTKEIDHPPKIIFYLS